MQKQSKKNLLIQSVLASTFFVAPMAAQAQNIVVPTLGPVQTSVDGSVLIFPNGKVTALAANNGVELNSAGGIVGIFPANLFVDRAIEVQGTGDGIAVIAGGTNGFINIGQASGVTVIGAGTGNAINVANSGTSIVNAGTLQVAGPVATGAVVEIELTGDNTSLTNLVGGVIRNELVGVSTEATIKTNAGSTGFVLTNNGIITQTTTLIDTIELNGVFTSITNQSNGVISQTDKTAILNTPGSAIHITGTASGSGFILNQGLITAAAGPDTILIDNVGAVGPMTLGAITNEGTVSNTSTTLVLGAGGAISINAQGSLNDITILEIANSGTLSSVIPAFATVTTFDAAKLIPGNTVIITEGLVNSGDIVGGKAIVGNGPFLSTGLTVAIDFATQKTFSGVTQNDGTISGNVYLAQKSATGGPVFTMTGGTIAGDVFAQNAFQNTFDVSGGDLTGTLTFGSSGFLKGIFQENGLGDTLNLSGGFIHIVKGTAAAGNTDTINITGGDFDFINTSADAKSFTNVNINASFTQDGTINGLDSLLDVNVNNPGTVFTLNGNIFNLNGTLTVDAGTTFVPNGFIDFTGDGSPAQFGLLNNGTVLISGSPVFDMLFGSRFLNTDGSQLVLAPGGLLTINGNGTEDVLEFAAGSSLVTQINGFCPPGDDAGFGLIVVNSVFDGTVVDFQPGSFIVPQFSGVVADEQFIPLVIVNDPFASVPGHLIDNDATVVQPASATIFFETFQDATPGVFEVLGLIAHRNAFAGFAGGAAGGVAGALDDIVFNGICNNDLCTLIGNLDQLPTAEDVELALDSLTPVHNYGLIAATHIGIDSMFEGITDRVWDVAWHHRDHGRRHSGRPVHVHDNVNHHHHHHAHPVKKVNPPSYQMTKDGGVSFGDLYNHAGIWLRPIVAYVDQSSDDGVPGYRAKAWGGALGADWGVTDCTTLGAAISYTKVNVDDKAWAPKDEQVEAWMGTLYGSFDFTHGVFFDAMVAGAHNDYDVNRVIAVNNLLTAAQGSFDGTTWAAQADLGMALPNVDFFLAPFARLKWVHVDFDDFTETGAGDLNLAVSMDDANEFLGGIGIRMAGDIVAGDIEWVPELMAMIGYDFELDGEDSLANFINCGPAFATDGVTPGRTVFDLGLALNAMIGPCQVITAKYNLELREDYVGNAAYLQYFYNWS